MPNRSLLFVASIKTPARPIYRLILLCGLLAFGFPSINSSSFDLANFCVAQTQPEPQDQSDLEKPMKYHAALLSRPSPDYLFDRFYNSWLDVSSIDDLKKFLIDRADDPKAKSADRLLLAFFYAKQGKDIKALQQFQVALEKNPNNIATLYEMAVIQARTLDIDSALTHLRTADNANPSAAEHVKIAQLQGKLLAQNLQPEEAKIVWDALVNSNPNDLGLMEDLIELQLSEGMFIQAIALSDKLIAASTDPVQQVIRQLRKADILRRSGNQTKALEVYKNSLAQVGMNTWVEREILSQVEQLFRREDNLTGLNKYLTDLIKTNHQRIAVRNTQVKILMELGQVNKAIETYEKIIELTPGSRENREAFTNLLIQTGKTDRAIKQMEALVAQHSKDAELQVRLADLCHQGSKPLKAKAALDEFISLSGSTEYSYLRAARLFEKFNDPEKARAAYQTALDKFKESDSVKESWADFLFRSGSKDEAIKVWQVLAKETDRAGLVSLARMLSVRKMNQVAFDMLLARYDELKLDSIYLGQLCNEAVALKKFPQAVTWAIERVRLAKTSTDVDSALPSAVLIIESANAIETTIESFRKKRDRSSSETCLLSEMLERALLWDEAESILQTKLEANKAAKKNQDIQILARQKVRLARKRYDWLGATHAARELIDLPGGRNSQNVRQLVELYQRVNDDESALKLVGEWKRLSPGSPLPWVQEAALLERSGKTDASIAVLRRATQEFPNDSDLSGQLATKYIRHGQPENAERIFWRQYENSEKPADKMRWARQLAKAAHDAGTTDRLVKRFEERRKNNPQSIEPLLAIAEAHRVAGDYEQRRAALIKATRLKKDDLPLLRAVARLEESKGDWEKAIQTLGRADVLDKTNQSRQKIAQLYFEYGETEQGLAQLLEISDGKKSTEAEIEGIAKSILKTQDWELLLNFLAPNVARFPTNYRLKYMAAIAHEEAGNTDAAKVHFLELLKSNQEIAAGLTNLNSPFQRRRLYYQGVLPPSANDLKRQLWETPTDAYSYRKYAQLQQGGNSIAQPSINSVLKLPGNQELCHEFALIHLCTLARDLPKKEREKILKQLERVGIENVKLLMADVPSDFYNRNPTALVDIDPDSEAALAITMESCFNARLPEAVYLKAYETFKESVPAIGLIAAFKLQQTYPRNENLNGETRLADAIKQLKKIKNPKYWHLYYVSQVSYQYRGDKSYQATLNQLLLDWSPALQKTPQGASWTFTTVSRALQFEESPKRLVEFMDQQLVRIKNQGNPKVPLPSSYSSRRRVRESILALPDYPPAELYSFPQDVYQATDLPNKIAVAVNTAKDPMLKTLLQLRYFHSTSPDYRQGGGKIWHEKLTQEELNSIKEAFGEQVTNPKSAIDRLLAESNRNVDAWYLAGTLAVSEKRWNDATISFETMRKLPLTAATRRKIDEYLVALVTIGIAEDFENKKYELALTAAKAAALRLRRGTLTQVRRFELVSTFELLGLEEEAKKMESQIAIAGGASAAARPVVRTIRIDQLHKAGKTDAVVRLLSQEFKELARRNLSLNNNRFGLPDMPDFKQKVYRYGSAKQLLERLDPGENANARKLAAFGFAKEVFGTTPEAEKVYKELLETYPQENGVRLRFVLLASPHDKQIFAREFAKVNKQYRTRFLQAMLRQTNEADVSVKDRLSLVEAMVNSIEEDQARSIDNLILTPLLETIVELDSVGTNGGIPLYAMLSQKTAELLEITQHSHGSIPESVVKSIAIIKWHQKLHDRVASLLTDSRIPGDATRGFSALLASAEAVRAPVDNRLVSLALKTVHDAKNSDPNLQIGTRSSYSQDSSVRKRTPVEFLASYYGQSKTDHSKQVQEIATKLELLRAKKQAKQLQNTYRLYRVSEDKFVAVARELITAAKESSTLSDQQKWRIALASVFEIWKKRKLKADISSFWIDYASRSFRWSNHQAYLNQFPTQTDQEPVGYFLREFASVNEVPAIEDFMTQLRFKMLGSEKRQLKLSKLLVNAETVQKNFTKLQPVGTYFSLAKLLRSRKTFWLFLKESRRFQFPIEPEEFDFDPDFVLDEMLHFDPEEGDLLIEWLRQSPFLTDLSNFDPAWEKVTSGPQTSVWGDTLKQFATRHYGSKKAEIAKQLLKQADRTFGEDLLLKFVQEKPVSIYELIGADLDAFKTLPEEQQIQLANFASEINDFEIKLFGKAQVEKLLISDEGNAVMKTCLRFKVKQHRATVAKLMKTKRWNDAGFGFALGEGFENTATKFLESINSLPPKEFLAVVVKFGELNAKRLVEERVRLPDTAFKSRLIESAIGTTIDTASLKLVLAALENEDLQELQFSEKLTKYISQFLTSQLSGFARDQASKQSGDSSATDRWGRAMKRMIDKMDDQYGSRDWNTLFPELCRVAKTFDPEDSKAIRSWLHSNEEVKYPKVKQAFRIAFDCDHALRKWRGGSSSNAPRKRPTETKSYFKEILDFVDDDSNSLQARFRVATYLVLQHDGLSCEGVTTCCQLIAEAYDAGHSNESSDDKKFFTALTESSGARDIKDISVTFAKSWIQSVKKRNPLFTYRKDGVLGCLKMLIKTGDKAEVRNFLNASSLDPSLNIKAQPQLEIAVTLVECDYFEEAKTQFDLVWSQSECMPSKRRKLAYYTKTLEAKLPKFFELFDDDGSKYFAKLYFAALNNAYGDKEIKTSPESRLTELADELPSVQFKSKRERQMSLVLLSTLASSLQVIDEQLTKEIKGLSVVSLMKKSKSEDAKSDLDLKLLGVYFSTQIKLKKLEPVRAKWQQINYLVKTRYVGNYNGRPKAAVEELSSIACNSFYEMLRDQTPEQIAELLPALRDLNNSAYSIPLNPNTAQLAHLMAGRPDELATFLKEKRAGVLGGVARRNNSKSLNVFIRNLNVPLSKIKPTNPKVRTNFVSSCWRYAKSQGFSYDVADENDPQGNIDLGVNSAGLSSSDQSFIHRAIVDRLGIEQVATLDILTDSQILELGPELAETWSINGDVWLQLARRQVKAGQNKKAAESFKKSIDEATNSMKMAKLNRRVEYANTLVALKRNAEAKAAIDGILVDDLENANTVILEKLREVLNTN